jgi:hypothetical protein
VTGAGLNKASELCSCHFSVHVRRRPLATSSMVWNSSQPTSSIVALPVTPCRALTPTTLANRATPGWIFPTPPDYRHFVSHSYHEGVIAIARFNAADWPAAQQDIVNMTRDVLSRIRAVSAPHCGTCLIGLYSGGR